METLCNSKAGGEELAEATALQLGKKLVERVAVQRRESDGMHLAGTMVWLANRTGEENDWSEVLKCKGLNAWTRVKIQGCYHEDDQRKSIAQQILQKSTDFLRRIIASVGGPGGVTLSYVCPHSYRLPMEDYIWWFQ